MGVLAGERCRYGPQPSEHHEAVLQHRATLVLPRIQPFLDANDLRFVRDHPVTTEEVARLVVELATRAERWLSRQGFGADDGEEEHGDDDALPLMQAASVQGRSAVSGGRRARRFQVHRVCLAWTIWIGGERSKANPNLGP